MSNGLPRDVYFVATRKMTDQYRRCFPDYTIDVSSDVLRMLVPMIENAAYVSHQDTRLGVEYVVRGYVQPKNMHAEITVVMGVDEHGEQKRSLHGKPVGFVTDFKLVRERRAV